MDDSKRIKKQIYIGRAPAVSGRNLNRWPLQCFSSTCQGAETLNSLPLSLISSLTTAHLRRARKTRSTAGFRSVELISHRDFTHQCRFGPLHEVVVVGSVSWFWGWTDRVGYNDSFLDCIIFPLCLDLSSSCKDWHWQPSMLPEINNKVRHFDLLASCLVAISCG